MWYKHCRTGGHVVGRGNSSPLTTLIFSMTSEARSLSGVKEQEGVLEI